MIVRYTADINDGYITDSEVTEFDIGDFTATLNFGDEFLESITIERNLTDNEVKKLDNRIEPGSSNRVGTVTLGLPEGVTADAKRKLQAIESFCGLNGLKELNWKYPEIDLIPESDEEKEQIDVLNWDFDKVRKVHPHVWGMQLDDKNWELIEELRVPMSFYRRGNQLLDDGDYVNAFTNFYFIIEGLYAEGQHQNVEKKFLKSDELMHAVETTFPDAWELAGDDLKDFFEFYSKDVSPGGYVRLIVTIRHNLNHFFHEHGGPHDPSPINADQFEVLSKCMAQLTFFVLQMEINDFGPE